MYCKFCLTALRCEIETLEAARCNIKRRFRQSTYHNLHINRHLPNLYQTYIDKLKKLIKITLPACTKKDKCQSCFSIETNYKNHKICDFHEWHRLGSHFGISIQAKFSCSYCNKIIFSDLALFVHFSEYHENQLLSTSLQVLQYKRAKQHFQATLTKGNTNALT